MSYKPAKRKVRSITVTDSEWDQIRIRASQAGMPISRYLVERSLQADDILPDKTGAVPDGLQWEVAEAILMASQLIQNDYDAATLSTVRERVRQHINIEKLLR